MKNYEIVLFDLDGTLTDPKEGITKSIQYSLNSFGIKEDLENLDQFIGPPLHDTFKEYYKFEDKKLKKLLKSIENILLIKGYLKIKFMRI